jgi:hypothetical protein
MSSIKKFDFKTQLVLSTGTAANKTIGEILLDAIPGSLRAIQSLEKSDRQGVDWWLDMKSGERVGVDCKIRGEDPIPLYKKDDLALETLSVVEKNKIGWSLDESKKTDYVFWIWKDSGRWCLVPFLLLVKAFKEKKDQWVKTYKVSRQNTDDRYHSECVFVDRAEVWREIYRQSHGCSDSLRQEKENQPDMFIGNTK